MTRKLQLATAHNYVEENKTIDVLVIYTTAHAVVKFQKHTTLANQTRNVWLFLHAWGAVVTIRNIPH